METFKVVLTVGSVDEILWLNHSNQNLFSSTLTRHYLYLCILQNECYALLGVKGLKCIIYYKLLIILQDTYRIVQFLKEYPL